MKKVYSILLNTIKIQDTKICSTYLQRKFNTQFIRFIKTDILISNDL